MIGRQAQRQQTLLQDQPQSQEFLGKIKINMPYMRKFLNLVKIGRHDQSFERRFLLELERNLMIQNSYYRSLRRLASTWDKQPESTKKLVMTRLLQIMRTKARRSELLPMIEYVSKKDKLEDRTLEPIQGEGPEWAAEKPVKSKKMGFLGGLAAAGVGTALGATAGYRLARNKKST